MKILAVDSSSLTAGAAILEEKEIIADFFINNGLTHSQTLAPMIDCVLKISGVNIEDIDVFAVSNGPGSFTGLRIGVAAVKAMSLVTGKKCIGVSSLLAAAYGVKNFEGVICACMDARRGQIYNALFEIKNGELKRLTEDRAISLEDLEKELESFKSKIKLVGDGAKMCYNILACDNLSEKFSLASESERYVNAKSVGLAAFKNLNEENLLDSSELNPKYLRLSQAERLLKEKKSN